MSKLIVIIGVTGTQGKPIAEKFLAEGWRVRGTSRNPNSDSSKALQKIGIEVVRAELDDTDSLNAAFRGANIIFAVTDFWAPFGGAAKAFDGAVLPHADRHLPNVIAYNNEVQWGKNIANAASDTEILQTLERFVFSSLSDAGKWSKGKYTWVYHFESKAHVVDWIRAERKDLADKMSTIQIAEYMTNWKKYPMLAPVKQKDGTFVLKKPEDGTHRVPMIYVERDTGELVHCLIQDEAGKNLLAYGSIMTWQEWLNLWCRVLKVEGRFEQVSEDDYLGDAPWYFKKEVAEGHCYQAEFGWAGGDPDVIEPHQLSVQPKVTTVQEYIEQEDWSSIL